MNKNYEYPPILYKSHHFMLTSSVRFFISSHGRRRDEIEISKLIGATNAFIRRPFLYSGLQQGLLGGIVAVLLVSISLALLADPIRDLAELYDAELAVGGLNARGAASLAIVGATLGWAGAWLAVSRHLREIEPA